MELRYTKRGGGKYAIMGGKKTSQFLGFFCPKCISSSHLHFFCKDSFVFWNPVFVLFLSENTGVKWCGFCFFHLSCLGKLRRKKINERSNIYVRQFSCIYISWWQWWVRAFCIMFPFLVTQKGFLRQLQGKKNACSNRPPLPLNSTTFLLLLG